MLREKASPRRIGRYVSNFKMKKHAGLNMLITDTHMCNKTINKSKVGINRKPKVVMTPRRGRRPGGYGRAA